MSAKKTKPMPRVTTRTITARSLLLKIRRLILAEPRRLNMGIWVTAFGGRVVDEYTMKQHTTLPACGTVACLAGWGAVLLRPKGADPRELNQKAERVFNDLLGIADEHGECDVDGLFDSNVVELDGIEDEDTYDLPPAGTKAHAEFVAKRIDAYLSKYSKELNRKIDVAHARELLQ